MENIILECKSINKYSNPMVSNGYIHSDIGISVGEQAVPRVDSAIKAIAFYAASNGNEFKVFLENGLLYRAEKQNNYKWSIVGEISDSEVIGADFNHQTGNILICTKKEIFLIDRNIVLLKQKEHQKHILQHINESDQCKAHSKWSEDNKYINMHINGVICIFGYDLTVVSDTMTTSNKIMNSRLMRTKKYLMHESAYVDVVKRVEMPDNQAKETEDTSKKDSVLFEEQTKYKLSNWHNQFSLVYTVTDQNIIYQLERSSYKFKQIQHLRATDLALERIEENNILYISSYNSYFYLLHQEASQIYLKIYLIKNNTVYLKASYCITTALEVSINTIAQSILPTINVSKDITREQSIDIEVITSSGIVCIKQKMNVNRTETDTIDIDGARLLYSNLSTKILPPPFYSTYAILSGVPQNIKCYSNGYIQYTYDEQKYYIPNRPSVPGTVYNSVMDAASEGVSTLLNSNELHALDGEVFQQTIQMKNNSSAVIRYIDTKLSIVCEDAQIEFSNVTGVGWITLAETHIIISCVHLSWTYLHKIDLIAQNSSKHFSSEIVGRTGKFSKLVFVCPKYTVLMDQYGMLETFYLPFMVEYQMKLFAEGSQFKESVALAKRHGVSLGHILPQIVPAIHAGKISPSLLLDITKQLFTSYTEHTDVINQIEEYVLKNIHTYLSSTEHTTTEQMQSTTSTLAQRRNSVPIYLVAVEILLFRKEHTILIDLLNRLVTEQKLLPYAFSLTEEHTPVTDILKKILAVVPKDELIKEALLKYAYTLCYIILEYSDSPSDEINDLLLTDNAKTINPFSYIEEAQRRLRIAILFKETNKQVSYTVLKTIIDYTSKHISHKDTSNQYILDNQSSKDNKLTNSTVITTAINHSENISSEKNSLPETLLEQEVSKESITKVLVDSVAIDTLARRIIDALKKECIRNYYAYLRDNSDLEKDISQLFSLHMPAYTAITTRMLVIAGDLLVREKDLEEALKCYLAAGPIAKEQRQSLQLKLGLWRDLFIDPETRTPEYLRKMESVLAQKEDSVEIGLMQIQYGSYINGLCTLISAQQYTTVQEYLKDRPLLSSTEITTVKSQLLSKLEEYITDIAQTTEKYQNHQIRLQSVRERKDKEREAILSGYYDDGGCGETVYTRSFITNTFLTNSKNPNHKKKRSSKLRNTVGGRYEEEYVQYVLSELINRVISQIDHLQTISNLLNILHPASETKEDSNPNEFTKQTAQAYSALKEKLKQFSSVFSPSFKEDFLSQNTEEDPLYDPERPVIDIPAHTSTIFDYIHK
ncbi:hypothetical protein NEOKW01_0599 [Nematocida sp. AWRm80]|nr:hypothetical protein NEOKW01_0599 [Nematocida sp. AWRm80]